MALSADDEARLPPMIPFDEVERRNRRDELRKFRQYLVDTGAVKCLVKLHQHIVRKEMNLDNPNILKEFLRGFEPAGPETEEVQRLSAENVKLREYNENLIDQAEELARELEDAQRLSVGRTLWRHFVAPEFWGGQASESLSLQKLYQRLLGNQVDVGTGKVLVDLLRPPALTNELLAAEVSRDTFINFVGRNAPNEVHDWCRDTLLPRFSETRLETAPFEAEMLQEIKESGMCPNNLKSLHLAVNLEESLVAFLEAVAQELQWALAS